MIGVKMQNIRRTIYTYRLEHVENASYLRIMMQPGSSDSTGSIKAPASLPWLREFLEQWCGFSSNKNAESTSMSIIVWDFDHSLINDNTDTWYATVLAPQLAVHYDRSRQWTDLMHEQMGRLQGLGFSSQQIRSCFHSIPMVRSNGLKNTLLCTCVI
jgi:hypothetical protein